MNIDRELSEATKEKITDLVEIIANEYLEGKPAMLANCLYTNLERETITQIEGIKQALEALK